MSTGDKWPPDEPQGTETRDARRARCVPDEPWRMASESRSVTVASMPGSRWPYVFRVTVMGPSGYASDWACRALRPAGPRRLGIGTHPHRDGPRARTLCAAAGPTVPTGSVRSRTRRGVPASRRAIVELLTSSCARLYRRPGGQPPRGWWRRPRRRIRLYYTDVVWQPCSISTYWMMTIRSRSTSRPPTCSSMPPSASTTSTRSGAPTHSSIRPSRRHIGSW